jgi:hypothetical protein
MPSPLPRPATRLLAGGRLALQVLILLPTATAADSSFRIDVARKGDYVAQTNFVQCVGASMQMMLNMIEPKNDRTAKTQLKLQKLARSLSGPSRTGRERQGASVRGWTAGLNSLDAGPYQLVGTETLDEALRTAAIAIRETGKPVGLLVWRGRHAWVMSGFTSTADPMLTDDFKVTGAVILDPLYPHGSKVWGPSPKPRETLTPKEVGRQFVPRRQGNWPTGSTPSPWSILSTLGGKYVLVLPYEIDHVHTLAHRVS